MADDDEVTEVLDMVTSSLRAVDRPANGTPWLLLKAAAPDKVDCPTCKGKGTIMAGNRKCPDCGGDGKVTTEKADEMTKAEMSAADQNDLPDSDFAFIEPGGEKDADGKTTPRAKRHFPIHDAAHVRNALGRAAQSPFGEKAMPKIQAAAKKFGIDVAKAEGDDLATVPGSSTWEATDAANLRQVATLLADLKSKVEMASDRERTELMAGAEDDPSDVWDLDDACSLLDASLGIVAAMAFKEGQESADAAGQEAMDDASMVKAGKRLSTKSVAAIKTAQSALKGAHDSLTDLLGADQDQTEEVDDMTKAELEEMLAAQNEQLLKSIETRDEAMLKSLDDRFAALATTGTESVTDETVAKSEGTEGATETEGSAKPTGEMVKAEESVSAIDERLARMEQMAKSMEETAAALGAHPRPGGPALNELAGRAIDRSGVSAAPGEDLYERFVKADAVAKSPTATLADRTLASQLGEQVFLERLKETGLAR